MNKVTEALAANKPIEEQFFAEDKMVLLLVAPDLPSLVTLAARSALLVRLFPASN